MRRKKGVEGGEKERKKLDVFVARAEWAQSAPDLAYIFSRHRYREGRDHTT